MPESDNKPESIVEVKKHWHEKTFKELFAEFRDFLEDLVDLRDGMDQRGTIKNILNNKRMRGANAWLLMCSIMVASLGLNLNSPAVIIGAMLISPLMSPILGIGLGVGINDRETLFISLQHFGIAIIIALITSYIYFTITPLSRLTNEILSRTEPNLLDGLVAIFGGFAGVISTTRKDKSNAIPGVAIATALMPPLCVAGYGLAEGEYHFFLNAFYLFFLNSFFIAVSTYIVIRLLRFRYKEYPNKKESRRNKIAVGIFSILILFPAINLLYKAYLDLNEERTVRNFIEAHLEDEDTAISDWNLNHTDSITYLDIQLIGGTISQEKIDSFDKALDELLKKDIRIIPFQSREIPFDEITNIRNEVGGLKEGIAAQVENLQKSQQEREKIIKNLQAELDSIQNEVVLTEIFEQAKITHPLIEEIGFAKDFQRTSFAGQDSTAIPTEMPILLVKWNRKKSLKTRKEDERILKEIIKRQVKVDTLLLMAY